MIKRGAAVVWIVGGGGVRVGGGGRANVHAPAREMERHMGRPQAPNISVLPYNIICGETTMIVTTASPIFTVWWYLGTQVFPKLTMRGGAPTCTYLKVSVVDSHND